jgi:hypothetical protein
MAPQEPHGDRARCGARQMQQPHAARAFRARQGGAGRRGGCVPTAETPRRSERRRRRRHGDGQFGSSRSCCRGAPGPSAWPRRSTEVTPRRRHLPLREGTTAPAGPSLAVAARKAGWFGRRVACPGRHRLGLKFRLIWRVRTYQTRTRTADGLIARARRECMHDCAAVPRQHRHSSALLHAVSVAMDGGSTSTESLYMGAFLTDLR